MSFILVSGFDIECSEWIKTALRFDLAIREARCKMDYFANDNICLIKYCPLHINACIFYLAVVPKYWKLYKINCGMF